MLQKKIGTYINNILGFFKIRKSSIDSPALSPALTGNIVLHYFDGLELWKYFTEKSGATANQVTLVKNLVDYALPLLERYIDTFPKYTLHNLRHQQNIVKLMGDLLGPDLKKLTSLECAILILSAVFHDLGMVFQKTEMAEIEKETLFKSFLATNAKAKLQYERTNEVLDTSLTEWYCRWAHAKRVWAYLD